MSDSIFLRHSELKELLRTFRHEVMKLQRPATEVVMDDEDVMAMLKISKRKLQYSISKGSIPFHHLPR